MFKIINISKEVRLYSCDECGKEFVSYDNELPVNWVFVGVAMTDENKATSRESHFCSVKCAKKYIAQGLLVY